MLIGTSMLSAVQACLPLHDQKLQLYLGVWKGFCLDICNELCMCIPMKYALSSQEWALLL